MKFDIMDHTGHSTESSGRRDIQVGLSGQSEEGKQMTDVLDDLKKWANLKVGDQIPNEWGPPLTAILKAAIAEIERLRRKAGAVSDGESFNEVRRLARAGAPMVKYDNSLIKADRIVDKPSDTE